MTKSEFDDERQGNEPRQDTDDDLMPDLSGVENANSARQEEIRTEPAPGQLTGEKSSRRRIGPYKILQKIAEGGMGAVYMAEQEQPIRRRVALKLIKAGKDSAQIIARFEAERQALAMMEHPNIAKILDAGADEDGSPYFVMELVQGIPFTEYCDRQKLSIDERLQLFIPVCQAIQHAHHKGIIHRDLKPSNVLVGLFDGEPVPKVIDFGLAKATQRSTRLTDKTMFTEFGKIMGTLQYMSPEQAGLDQLDIDTRTDVYSLGVMLYELLTGSTPLDRQTMKQKALLKVLELIREQDPPRPSNRLSSSAQTASEVGQRRDIAPEKLRRVLKGELDWIVMKALEKNRSRRYETATEFVQDIQRYLKNEAVVARPPSTGYRLSKLVGANRGFFTAVGVVIGVLFAASIVSGWFAFETDRARDKERIARGKAEKAKERSDVQAEIARNAQAAEMQAKEKTEETLSRTNFHLATARWDMDRPINALTFLDKVLERYRNFEWYFARHQFAGETFSITTSHLISGMAVSPDGSMIASANGKTDQDVGRIELWDTATGKLLGQLDVAGESVGCLEFSSDGKTLVAGMEGLAGKKNQASDKVHVFDVATGFLVHSFANQTTRVNNLAFSSDGSVLAVENGAPNAQKIDLWDVKTGKLARSFNVPQIRIDGLLIRGSRIFVSCKTDFKNRAIRILDMESGKLEQLMAETTGAWSFAVSHSGRTVVSTQMTPPAIHIRDVKTNKTLHVLEGHLGEIRSIDIAPDEMTFASSSIDGTVRIWELRTGKLLKTLKSNLVQALGVRFSPDSRQIFCSGYTPAPTRYQIKVWDLDKLGGRVTYSRNPTVQPAMLNDDRLATVNEHGELQLWSTNPLAVEEKIAGFPVNDYLDFQFSEDGRLVNGITYQGELATCSVEDQATPKVMSLYPDGARIFVGRVRPNHTAVFARTGFHDTRQAEVTFIDAWDVKTGEKLWTTQLPDKGYHNIQIANNRVVARQLWVDQRCFVLDLENGNVIAQTENAYGWFCCEPSTNRLYLPVRRNGVHRIYIYDLVSGNLLEDVTTVAQYDTFFVKASERYLILGKWGDIEILDKETLQPVDILKGHSTGLLDIAFHPHENKLVSMARDRTFRVWDLGTREELYNVRDVDFGVHSFIKFNRAGTKVVVPVNGRVFQFFNADKFDQAESGSSNLTAARSDPGNARSSRVLWHTRQIQTAESNGDHRVVLFHQACLLRTEPDNPAFYVGFHNALDKCNAAEGKPVEDWHDVVVRARAVKMGRIRSRHIPQLIPVIIDLYEQEKHEKAKNLIEDVLSTVDASELNPETSRLLKGVQGLILARQGQFEQAREHLKFARKLNPKPWWKHSAENTPVSDELIRWATRFSQSYFEIIQRNETLEELSRIAWEDWERLSTNRYWMVFEKLDRAPDPKTADSFCTQAEQIARNLMFCEQFDKAKVVASASVRLRKKMNPDDWVTLNAISLLGECFLKSDQPTAAKTMLEDAWRGLVDQQDQIPGAERKQVLRQAVNRLIRLSEMQNDEAGLEEYRKLLGKIEQ